MRAAAKPAILMPMNFAAEIRSFEKRADRLGIKRKTLHELVDAHHSTWKRWARGDVQPPMQCLETIDRYLRGHEKVDKEFSADREPPPPPIRYNPWAKSTE